MYELNDKIKDLSPYQPLKGDFSVRLDANESYISLPGDIIEEIKAETGKIDFNRYPDPLAERACAAFADYYGISKDFVTAGNGSDELISVITGGFFNKGDSVVIVSPDFSMYGFYCHISEVNAVVLNKGANLEISADDIISAVEKENAKGLVFSNPCNPTSLALPKDEVIKIIDSLRETLIVLDEAYMDFAGEPALYEALKRDNVIILKTCSKNFGLAAIRLGFAVADKKLTNALRAIKSPYNVNTLTAIAGSVVLSHKDYLVSCTKKIIKQREKLEEALKGIEGIKVQKSSTNFVFVKTDNSKKIFESLLKKGIAVRNLGGFLRINAGSDGENERFIKAFKEALYEDR